MNRETLQAANRLNRSIAEYEIALVQITKDDLLAGFEIFIKNCNAGDHKQVKELLQKLISESIRVYKAELEAL